MKATSFAVGYNDVNRTIGVVAHRTNYFWQIHLNVRTHGTLKPQVKSEIKETQSLDIPTPKLLEIMSKFLEQEISGRLEVKVR